MLLQGNIEELHVGARTAIGSDEILQSGLTARLGKGLNDKVLSSIAGGCSYSCYFSKMMLFARFTGECLWPEPCCRSLYDNKVTVAVRHNSAPSKTGNPSQSRAKTVSAFTAIALCSLYHQNHSPSFIQSTLTTSIPSGTERSSVNKTLINRIPIFSSRWQKPSAA